MAAPVDPKKIAFSILEYLQEVRTTANTDVSESLEVAIQCISDSFGVSLTSDEHKAQYSIQPLTLQGVFGLGIARKEQIEAALASANLPTQQAPVANAAASPSETELDKKFADYCRLLTEKGYFAGTTEGTPEYESKYTKAKAKFMEKYQTPTPAATTTPTPTPTPTPSSPPADQATRTQKAEEFKNLGNQKLSSHQYQEAIDNYTKAIEFDSTNAIYYANRAAGYSHLNKHQLAIDDCNQAISRNPNYGKAYSRLGLANFSLGKYAEAATNYKRALELDPNNATIKQSLESAEKKLRESTNPAAAPRAGFPEGLADIINNPLFQNLAQNLSGGNAGGAGAGAGAGTAGEGAVAEGGGENAGMPDVSQLLNNPALMNMAQNVMSQPGFSDMLNNPAMMNMAQSFMQNPEALSGILQGVFGNKGPGGAGGGAGGSQ